MALKEDFEKAAEEVKGLKSRPSNDDLLELYACYKQATEGDVSGSRPGMLDLKGRAKFDAWSKKRGTTKDAAMQAYIARVAMLLSRWGDSASDVS